MTKTYQEGSSVELLCGCADVEKSANPAETCKSDDIVWERFIKNVPRFVSKGSILLLQHISIIEEGQYRCKQITYTPEYYVNLTLINIIIIGNDCYIYFAKYTKYKKHKKHLIRSGYCVLGANQKRSVLTFFLKISVEYLYYYRSIISGTMRIICYVHIMCYNHLFK